MSQVDNWTDEKDRQNGIFRYVVNVQIASSEKHMLNALAKSVSTYLSVSLFKGQHITVKATEQHVSKPFYSNCEGHIITLNHYE